MTVVEKLLALVPLFLLTEKFLVLAYPKQPLKLQWLNLLPIGLLSVKTVQMILAPTSLVAGYLHGADHTGHIAIIDNLLNPNYVLSNPLLANYPQGIHNFLAQTMSLAGIGIDDRHIASRYLIAAWFEWVQLAALLQCCILIVMAGQRLVMRHQIFLLGVLIILFSIPGLQRHFLWSGFTTSLGITWISLLPLVLFSSARTKTMVPKFKIASNLILICITSLTVYQLYFPHLLAVSLLIFLFYNQNSGNSQPWRWWRITTFLYAVCASLLVPVIFLLAPSLRQEISHIVEYGWALNPPVVFSLALAVVLSVCALSWLRALNETILVILLVLLASASISWGLVAYEIAPFKWTQPVYYIQKMVWSSLLFGLLAVAVIVSSILSQTTTISANLGSRRRRALITVIGSLCLLLGVYSHRSVARENEISWLAKSLLHIPEYDLRKAAVFDFEDNLGSHVGNLILARSSQSELPIDLAWARNPFAACLAMRDLGTEVLFVREQMAPKLIDFGCSSNLLFVEEGETVIEGHDVEPAVLKPNQRWVHTSRELELATKTGFFVDDTDRNWATGYYSQLEFAVPKSSSNTELIIEISREGADGVWPIEWSISRSDTVEKIDSTTNHDVVRLPLPSRKDDRFDPGALEGTENIGVSMKCSRTWDEIRNEHLDGLTPRCFSLRSIYIQAQNS